MTSNYQSLFACMEFKRSLYARIWIAEISHFTQFPIGGYTETTYVHGGPWTSWTQVSRRATVSVSISVEISSGEPFDDCRSREFSDIYVTCQLVADNKPLTITTRTSFKAFKKDYTCVLNCGIRLVHSYWMYNRWNEWITLPIRYCDLPLNSQITFTVWDIAGPRAAVPVGGSTFRLFGKKWWASGI